MKKSTLLLGTCFLAGFATAQQPTPGGPFIPTSFVPKQADSVGIYPHFAAFGDFNLDGKPDLVVARGSSGGISVIPNTSTGGSISFGAQRYLGGAGNSHEAVAVGDIDGDGKPDIVVANGNNSASVTVYRNMTTGAVINFGSGQDFAVVNAPYRVVIGDLDGDGKPDLAVTNNGSNQVSFFRNTSSAGNISFATRVDITVGNGTFGVAIGDLDGDGKPDLAVGTQGPGAALYAIQNTSTAGSLSFGVPIGIATGGGGSVAIRDLDGDGKPDIVEGGFGQIIVVRNQSGVGSLVFGGAQNFYNDGSYVPDVVISDLDGDHKADIAAVSEYSNAVSCFHNTSPSGAITFASYVNYGVELVPSGVAAADLDGDGRPDLVVANSSTANVSVLRNIIGANVAPELTGFTPSGATQGGHVTITGVNLGGATAVSFGGVAAQSYTVTSPTSIDAVVGAGNSGNVMVTTPYGVVSVNGFGYQGPVITNVNPTIGSPGTSVVITGSNFTGATAVSFGGVAAAAFTVNSATSITATVGTGAGGAVMVTTPLGTYTFGHFVFGVPTLTGVSPLSGAIGSSVVLTGTGFGANPADNIVYFGGVRATVTAAGAGSITVTVPKAAGYSPVSVTTNGLTAWSARPFSVVFAVDSPLITSQSFARVATVATGGWPRGLVSGDLDGDGKPDVVTGNQNDNSLMVLLNKSVPGVVSFAPAMTLATGPDVLKVTLGDIDGDGKLDIVEVNFNSGGGPSSVSVYKNTSLAGTLSFAPRQDIPMPVGSTDVVVADMDGDGKPDLLVPSGNAAVWSIYPNTTTAGMISFGTPTTMGSLWHATNIAVADLDNDGRPDVIASNFGNTSISVYRNLSAGGHLQMSPSTDYVVPSGSFPTFVSTADLDGDGLLDVAVSNYSLNSISFFRNVSTPGTVALVLQQTVAHPPTTLNFADLNGDGQIDLLSGQPLSGKMSVYENTSAAPGLFSFNNNVDFSPSNYDIYTTVADIDGDGRPDLLAATTDSNSLIVYRNLLGNPVIRSVVPDSAVKGQVVTISGSGLTGTTAVWLGGLPVDSFSVVDGHTIHAVVGKGNSGAVEVVAAGLPAKLDGFRFVPQIRPVGTIVVCRNQSLVLSSTAGSGNQWYKDGQLLTGDTAASLTVTAAGRYTVAAGANGISMAGDSAVTVLMPGGTAPVITRNPNNDLVSSDTSGNQWMLNGAPIAGATGVRYHPAESGPYTVVATISGCVTEVSAPYYYTTKGMIDLGNGQFVNLFPNPVRNGMNIYWNVPGMAALDVVISDQQGRQVRMIRQVSNGAVVDLTGLMRGVYNVKIYSEGSYPINQTVHILKVD
jgi:hypothetical protein